MDIKRIINKILIATTGFQLARPNQTLHFEGAMKRDFDNNFIRESKPYGRILDIGAAPISFAKTHYQDVVTFDQFSAPHVDIVGDLHELSRYVEPNSFDTVICTEVFEHTQRFWEAISEIEKVLKPGGLFIGTAPFSHELHGEEYGDFWRISPQGWEYLLRNMTDVKIKTRGVYPQINHVAASARKKPAH